MPSWELHSLCSEPLGQRDGGMAGQCLPGGTAGGGYNWRRSRLWRDYVQLVAVGSGSVVGEEEIHVGGYGGDSQAVRSGKLHFRLIFVEVEGAL